jgi:hypothetical protein
MLLYIAMALGFIGALFLAMTGPRQAERVSKNVKSGSRRGEETPGLPPPDVTR